MKLTANQSNISFLTSIGTLSTNELARVIRKDAGFDTIGGFETAMGIEHPRWYHLEKGKWKNPTLLLETMVGLGYEITITKGKKQ